MSRLACVEDILFIFLFLLTKYNFLLKAFNFFFS